MLQNTLTPEEALLNTGNWVEEIEEVEGQLAIDVYQTPSDIVLKAPIAGVKKEDLDVTITDEKVTIRGERHNKQEASAEDFLVQECYWGSFSRIYTLPIAVDADKAVAKLVDGILTITIPKAAKARTRSISIE